MFDCDKEMSLRKDEIDFVKSIQAEVQEELLTKTNKYNRKNKWPLHVFFVD